MAYSRGLRDQGRVRRPGGVSGRFGPGMTNPSFGSPSTQPIPGPRQPGGRTQPEGGFGPGNRGFGPGHPAYRGDDWRDYMIPGSKPPITAPQGGGGGGGGQYGGNFRGGGGDPGWLKKLRVDARKSGGAAGRPEIPGQREIADFAGYEGSTWSPEGSGYEGGPVDTAGLIDATAAQIAERRDREGGEAARRFGQLGTMMSGGGLGGGYAGTLGESERAYGRDVGEMTHRYRFQAEQADAQMREAARQAGLSRSFAAHEGAEGRRFGSFGAEQDYNKFKYGAGADYDRFRYGAELGESDRAQQESDRKLQLMFSMYGM